MKQDSTLLFSPNITTWEMFAGKIKETCEINPKQQINITYNQKFGNCTYNTHLKEKTYKTICDYVQSHQYDDHFLVSIHTGIKHNTTGWAMDHKIFCEQLLIKHPLKL